MAATRRRKRIKIKIFGSDLVTMFWVGHLSAWVLVAILWALAGHHG